ncbi:hypothetical protein CNY89_09635 [Amaricoccus sp. HAR-UPW-R2A-40]|nr:hypothetical protein CNY89_09635 [Amaricoccus sp. HAR-UPW-R2A-40]
MTKTYSNRSNATRAAKKDIAGSMAAGHPDVWFEIVEQGRGAWTYVIRGIADEEPAVNHEGDATPTAEDDTAMDMEPAATPVNPEPVAEAAPARARQNGILYPVAGTVAHAIWALAQGFADANGREAKPGDLKDQAEAAGINLASLGCGMGHRRKFLGIAKQRG